MAHDASDAQLLALHFRALQRSQREKNALVRMHAALHSTVAFPKGKKTRWSVCMLHCTPLGRTVGLHTKADVACGATGISQTDPSCKPPPGHNFPRRQVVATQTNHPNDLPKLLVCNHRHRSPMPADPQCDAFVQILTFADRGTRLGKERVRSGHRGRAVAVLEQGEGPDMALPQMTPQLGGRASRLPADQLRTQGARGRGHLTPCSLGPLLVGTPDDGSLLPPLVIWKVFFTWE